jgi:hypothetical protein
MTIYCLSKLLGSYHGLSAFLATEVLVAFHQTSNNSLRFHRFMEQLLSSVEKTGDLRFLGQRNVIEAYQQYCFKVYGFWDGSTDRNGVDKGVVCHQFSASCPISHYANLCSLQTLVTQLETAGLGPCNKARYGTLLQNMKKYVIGLGDLKAQKAVMNFASLGLFIDENFMCFFNPGSTQQLKNLKEPPFNISHQDQVTQLQHTLMIQQPHHTFCQCKPTRSTYVPFPAVHPERQRKVLQWASCTSVNILSSTRHDDRMAVWRFVDSVGKDS